MQRPGHSGVGHSQLMWRDSMRATIKVCMAVLSCLLGFGLKPRHLSFPQIVNLLPLQRFLLASEHPAPPQICFLPALRSLRFLYRMHKLVPFNYICFLPLPTLLNHRTSYTGLWSFDSDAAVYPSPPPLKTRCQELMLRRSRLILAAVCDGNWACAWR
jgi:hypothetical protein